MRIALFCLSLWSTAALQAQNTRISGALTHWQQGFFLIGKGGTAMDTIRLDAEGTFSVQLVQPQSDFYTLRFGRNTLLCYFLQNDDITISYNGKMPIDSIVFKGKSAPYCRYLQQENSLQRRSWNANQRIVNNPDKVKFVAERDSVRGVKDIFLAKSTAEHSFEPAFTERMRKVHLYQMGSEMITFENARLRNGDNDILPIRSAWQNIPLSDPTMLRLEDYRTFVSNAINSMAGADYQNSQEKTYYFYCDRQLWHACEKLTDPDVRSAVLPDMMLAIIDAIGKQDLRALLARFRACCPDAAAVERIEKQANYFTFLYPGNPAPDAGLYDANGKTYRLSDFKGQVLYIDVWATWCGPCRKEIPSLKELEASYHGKNVRFISISTDKDLQAWKDFLVREKMTGQQFHQADDPKDSMSQKYLVNSIPRFIVIDKSGRIVSADAPRPSSTTEVRKLLDGLLAE